jgi:predicted phage tail protein
MSKLIKGAGGGGKAGGGSARTPVESPDSLRSIQYARVLDLVAEGEIGGLVNGLKSIYLDDTPLQNPNGTFNFTGVSVFARNGTQSQSHIPAFAGSEAELPVSTQVTKAVPVTRSISNINNTAARVTLSIPQLTLQNLTNGDLGGTSVEIAIDVQNNGGGFVAQALRKLYQSSLLSITPSGAISAAVSTKYQVVVAWAGQNVKAPQTCTYQLQYRAVGSGTWLVSQSHTFQGGAFSTGGLADYALGSVTANYPSGSKTFDLTLAENDYEFRVVKTSGSVQNPPAFFNVPAAPSVGLAYGGSVSIIGGSVYAPAYTDVITGKTSSRYQRSYRIELPEGGPWDIRVRRITDDSVASNLQNDTYFDSITEIIDAKLTYPNSALVGLSIDAKQFNSIPTRGYEIYGLLIKVPSNYDPLTRAYTGTWDGTFTTAWSDNPAWVFYDMVTNARYGLGEFVSEDQVDKWGLYTIAQYCDVMVEDGFGGIEPRFTCNLYLQTREEAYRVVANLASIFRAVTFWGGGEVRVSQDAPQDVEQLFTKANVIEGQFSYSGSSGSVRHSVVLVSWNDPQDAYRQKIEYVDDDVAIARYGVIQTEIVALGCTSRGQAARVGRWLIYSEQNETETVTFRAGMDSVYVSAGSVITTQDPNRAGLRMGGRILPNSMILSTIDMAAYDSKSLSISAQETGPTGIWFSTDGLKMYVMGTSGDDVNQYALTTAWDVTTATYVTNKTLGAVDATPSGLYISDDGLKAYVCGTTTDAVYQYTLSTAWDISTLTYSTKFISIAAKEINSSGIFFKPDGSTMYITGNTSDAVHAYNLSIAWDVTTAVFANTFSVAAQETAPQDLFFSPDGLKMFLMGSTGDDINQYNLGTAWDIATAVYAAVFSVAAQDITPTGVFFRQDLLRFFMVGSTSDTVYQYSLPVTIYVDAPVIIESGKTYALNAVMPDKTLEAAVVINSPGSTSSLLLAEAFTQKPVDYAIWVLSNEDLAPEQWRVVSISEVEKTQFEITALAYRSDKYDAIEQDLILEPLPTSIINTGPPDSPNNLTVNESLYLAGLSVVGVAASVSWNNVDGAASYVLAYQLENQNPVTLDNITNTTVDIKPIAEGNYTFTVFAVNSLGRKSQSNSISVIIYGKKTPPVNVTDFSIIKTSGIAIGSWLLHPELDVQVGGMIVVRHSPLLTGATWQDGVILDSFSGNSVNGVLPLLTGTYMAKALDSSGNWSPDEISFVATEGLVTGFTTVATITESPDFSGSKTYTASFDGVLQLASVETITSMPGLISTWPKLSSLGGVSTAGSYIFEETMDLTTVATRRFESTISALSFDTQDLISFRGLVSEWGGVSGDVINDCDATLYISTTNDNPAGVPTWGDYTPFFVGDFTCRAARFKMDLISGVVTHNIKISQLVVKAKIPA